MSHLIRSLGPVTHSRGGRVGSDLLEGVRPVQIWVLPPILQPGYRRGPFLVTPEGQGREGVTGGQAALPAWGVGTEAEKGREREARMAPG